MCKDLFYHCLNVIITHEQPIELKKHCMVAIQNKSNVQILSLWWEVFIKWKMNQICYCEDYQCHDFTLRLRESLKQLHILASDFFLVELTDFSLDNCLDGFRKSTSHDRPKAEFHHFNNPRLDDYMEVFCLHCLAFKRA